MLVNDDRSRSFVTVPVEAERVGRLGESVDEVLVKYRRPPYYRGPSHISMASVGGDATERKNATIVKTCTLSRDIYLISFVRCRQVITFSSLIVFKIICIE